jgi:hypothetical protein
MPNIDGLFPHTYLRAVDFTQPTTVTILRVQQEEMENKEGEKETKPVIYFAEYEKGMVLNITNANILSEMYGKDYSQWTGAKVTLITPLVTAFGKTQPALRFSQDAPAQSRQEMVQRYAELFAEAKALKVQDLDSFVLAGDASEVTIAECGKLLREKVELAKKF